MRLSHAVPLVLVGALAASALAGCAAPATIAPGSGPLAVVASTSVYGDIARAIGGDAIRVHSLLSDPSQDPHSFEAGARAQLALAKADVVIENGGGYDGFVDTLLAGSRNAGVTLVNVVDVSGLNHSGRNFNEHVWYDFPAMANLADRLSRVFSQRDPAHRAAFNANAAVFAKGLAGLESGAAQVRDHHAGEGVAVTEPVPLYLLAACGLVNRTPVEFSRAVEDGAGVPPVLMQFTLELLRGKRVRLLVYNDQTTGPETAQLRAAAKAAHIPAVPVTETLPANATYLSWMAGNLAAVKAGLSND